MLALAILLTGYSIFSALQLGLTHFRGESYQDQTGSKVMGLSLLLALSALQFAHFVWLAFDVNWVATIFYRMSLFVVAPAFFLFSRPLLEPPTGKAGNRAALLGHAVPVLLVPLLPESLALPLAFVVGAGYLAWLAHSLYGLRQQRAGFRQEMLLLGSVFIIALVVSVLGLVQAHLADKLFFSLYAIAIGLALFLVQVTLALRPRLPVEVRETVATAYNHSTLTKIDCDAAIEQLASLMASERIFVDADLSLASLAARLGMSSHQLSELLNTRLGKSFSRYLRERRVDAAKGMLLAERSASVLSVGLSVGFTSQSNFYDAFREIEGMTPGQFRKLHPPET